MANFETEGKPMTDAPEKMPDEIMAWRSRPGLDHTGTWATTRYPAEAQSFTRTDQHLALVAAAYEKSGSAAVGWANAFVNGEEWTTCGVYNHITALTPDDAQAALERVMREAKNEARWEALKATRAVASKLRGDRQLGADAAGNAILALMEDTGDE